MSHVFYTILSTFFYNVILRQELMKNKTNINEIIALFTKNRLYNFDAMLIDSNSKAIITPITMPIWLQ